MEKKAIRIDSIWLLTSKFDVATWPFLKIDMRHAAYRHGQKK